MGISPTYLVNSVALVALTWVAGLVGCFSVVSFFPFASLFKHSITAALSTGMGTCWTSLFYYQESGLFTSFSQGINGLIPSLLAVGQDPGDSKRFSVRLFFIIIASFLALSLCSYLCILLLMKSARVRHHFGGDAEVFESLNLLSVICSYCLRNLASRRLIDGTSSKATTRRGNRRERSKYYCLTYIPSVSNLTLSSDCC